MASDSIALNTPITEGGVRAVSFFNGRLLTAGDLSREQQARRQADRRLGAALGGGVAWGLRAEIAGAASARQLRVGAGLGLNAAGQVLALAADQLLQLVAVADAGSAGSGGGFVVCQPSSGGRYVVGEGLWLLSLAPAQKPEGLAQVLALDASQARCNTDVVVEAVQFRLWPVAASLLPADVDLNAATPLQQQRLRQRVAAEALGTAALVDSHAHPGSGPAAGDLLARLRQTGLGDDELPLALVFMDATGLLFVDRWAVRRRLDLAAAGPALPVGAAPAIAPPPPAPAEGDWWPLAGPAVERLAEAQWLQFQEQLAEMPAALRSTLAARDALRWLPPAGLFDATVTPAVFLAGHTLTPETALAPSALRDVLAAALRRDPLRADQPAALRLYRLAGGTRWLYVREAAAQLFADEVAFRPAPIDMLPTVDTVQRAIEAVWAQRHCACSLVLTPAVDLVASLARLPAGQDVLLCFAPGPYPKLAAPLLLQGLGHVTVCGAGPGSLLSADAEQVLLVSGCRSLTLRDMGFAAGSAGLQHDAFGPGQRGALTVFDTPEVLIERVDARCSAGARLMAAAIVVNNGGLQASAEGEVLRPRSRVRVLGCRAQVGRRQSGLLCVDSDSTLLRDNLVTPRDGAKTPQLARGIVVAGRHGDEVRVLHNTVLDAVEGLTVALSQHEAQRGEPLRLGRVQIEGNQLRLRLESDDTAHNRFGIFVGHADSLRIEANRILRSTAGNAKVAAEGLRLVGVYGRQLLVRGQHVEGLATGLRFEPQGLPLDDIEALQALPPRLWRFEDNLAEGARVVLACAAPLLQAGLVSSERNRG